MAQEEREAHFSVRVLFRAGSPFTLDQLKQWVYECEEHNLHGATIGWRADHDNKGNPQLTLTAHHPEAWSTL